MANSKFANVSDEDMQALLNTKDSVNTQRVIKRSVAVFREIPFWSFLYITVDRCHGRLVTVH